MKWQPTPVFLPEKSYGWRSLQTTVQGVTEELDMMEQLNKKNNLPELGPPHKGPIRSTA